MAFLRYYVFPVTVLHAAILFTTFFSLHSEWSFLEMVNCQSDSSYLADMDAVDSSAPSIFGNDFSGMQDQDMFMFMPEVHRPNPSNRLARVNNYPPTIQEYPNNGQNSNVRYTYMSSRPLRRCCADCRDGDIYCLSSCERYGCKPTVVCANAGSGAYGSFCKRECDDQLSGFSAALTMAFLPDKACRANCVKRVQQMCARNKCRDYSCVVNNCASWAVEICG